MGSVVTMAAVPPNFSDLGKKARDLFSKGYNYGLFKIEAKTKTSTGVEFTANGNSNHESGKVVGALETKYKWKEYGLTVLEKWNTDNTLGTEISIEDQLIKGLKLSFDTQFAPQTGKKSGQIKTEYQREYIHTNFDIDFDFAGPTLNGALVAGYKGWLLGYQMGFDTAKSKLARSNFAIGYANDEFTLHTSVNDGSEFAGSVFQKINKQLDVGVNLSWTAGSNVTRFGIGARYAPDADTTYRAKVNNSSQVGFSYQQKIRDGVSLSLSTLIEGKSFNQGGHKVGLGLDFE